MRSGFRNCGSNMESAVIRYGTLIRLVPRWAGGLLRERQGSSLVELAVLTPLFVLLLAGSVDLGRACYAAIQVSAAAYAGAEYGVEHSTDTAGMQQAAVLNGANLAGLNALASWGCECPDGSSSSNSCASRPICSSNVVKYVLVTTSLTYKPALNFPGISSSLPLTGSARLRAAD